MAQTNKLKGCYRRIAIFLTIVAVIILVVGLVVYQLVGGIEGLRYWMAGYALNRVEAQLLQDRPDGVSETDIESQFETVREANKEHRTDLIQLYQVLRAYQTQFQKKQPSTGEVFEFLTKLESAILSILSKEDE